MKLLLESISEVRSLFECFSRFSTCTYANTTHFVVLLSTTQRENSLRFYTVRFLPSFVRVFLTFTVDVFCTASLTDLI